MNNIKRFSHIILIAASMHAATAQAEYHEVQPGEVLSLIAEQKRVQSGFLLSTEQIMLTLYKLNKNVFVNGDINQLIIPSKILIPDNTTDYIQLSKAEAQQRLQDKNYLLSLHKSAAPTHSVNTNKNPEYAKIIATLNAHQQSIEGLKSENKRLTTKFNLLEKALARVVLVQGLLTNNVTEIRKKLLVNTSPDLLEKEKTDINNTDLLELNHPKTETPTQKSAADFTKALDISSNAPLTSAPPETATVSVQTPTSEAASAIKLPSPTATPVAEPNKLILAGPDAVKSSNEGQNVPAPDTLPTTTNAPSAENHEPVKRKVMTEQKDASLLSQAAIIAGVILLGLMAWSGIRFYKSRRLNALADPENEDALESEDSVAPNFNFTPFEDEVDNKLIMPVKSIIEKSQKAVKELDQGNGLDSILELLDMCLLCGDYEQAHKVTMKALADHKSSPILAQKLSFIERKMAKL